MFWSSELTPSARSGAEIHISATASPSFNRCPFPIRKRSCAFLASKPSPTTTGSAASTRTRRISSRSSPSTSKISARFFPNSAFPTNSGTISSKTAPEPSPAQKQLSVSAGKSAIAFPSKTRCSAPATPGNLPSTASITPTKSAATRANSGFSGNSSRSACRRA